MKFTELIVLLPCHSLEDFPLYHEGAEAANLLASWTAPWHPALIAAVKALPTWSRVDAPPTDLAGRLLIVPQIADDRLLAGFSTRAQNEGAVVVRKAKSRTEIIEKALAQLDGGAAGVDDELAADFLALGFCRLQVELLTRQMRYSSNIDETHFQNEAVAAAEAAVAGDRENARSHLQQCFDVLDEARKYFYPVDAYLVDLTLVADSTLGATLQAELALTAPRNFLLSASLLRQIETEYPATLSALKTAIEAGSVSLIGGELEERELPLLPLETVCENLTRGLAEYQRLLGRRPKVYGRRRAGLSPLLPQLLTRLGFIGALHVTLDDGAFPLGGQSKARWEAPDGSVIDAITRLPRDVAKPETFLEFSRKMGESMDQDHVATLLFAHWPGQNSEWYDDLRRAARWTSALGKFVTLDEYFEQTDTAGMLSKFSPDDYRAPYLKQSIIRRQSDPISKIVREHQRRAVCDGRQAVRTLTELLGGQAAPGSCPEKCGEGSDPAMQPNAELAAFADVLPRQTSAAAPGYLLVNPLSFSRRIGVELSQLSGLPTVAAPVHAAGSSDSRQLAVVDVPSLGFAWVTAGQPSKSSAKPLAEGNVLRNEFFEVVISPTSGGVQSIHDYRQRQNRLSQQLAYRLPGPRPATGDVWRDPDEDASYSVMVADSVDVTATGPSLGEIVSRGRLVDTEGRKLAGFKQTAQAWFGSRVLVLNIEIEPEEEPRADPWNSYYAARFAWSDATADVFRSVGLQRHPTDAKRMEAPHFIEVGGDKGRTAVLTGGLPYHRRAGMRMIDSLLVVRGESARSFKLGIGIDLAHPAPAALELLAPVLALHETRPPLAGSSSGWLFHVDGKNIVATHWEPVWTNVDATDGSQKDSSQKPVARGFRVRLQETSGRAGRVVLRAFRALASAHQLDFQGQVLLQAPVEGDKIMLDFAAYEWMEVEAVWDA